MKFIQKCLLCVNIFMRNRDFNGSWNFYSVFVRPSRLGAWQFLADMPYSALSLKAVWNIFYCIYGNQMNQYDWSPGSEGRERGGREVHTLSTINEIIDALKGND